MTSGRSSSKSDHARSPERMSTLMVRFTGSGRMFTCGRMGLESALAGCVQSLGLYSAQTRPTYKVQARAFWLLVGRGSGLRIYLSISSPRELCSRCSCQRPRCQRAQRPRARTRRKSSRHRQSPPCPRHTSRSRPQSDLPRQPGTKHTHLACGGEGVLGHVTHAPSIGSQRCLGEYMA